MLNKLSLRDRAAVIPGRSLTRSKKIFNRWAASAEGAMVTDVDGKPYIDMGCALGAISLGYHPRQLHGAGVCTLPYEVEVLAAEAVLEHIAPWATHVRFTKTGSEATHAAYRMAKAATGRSQCVRFDGSYHGWHEWTDQIPVASKDSIPHRTDYAAVFVEPHRFDEVRPDWLRSIRKYCDRTGALMVIDEMIWGGRWALGGCTEYHGVTPDLACYGKAFGNGQSVAFVVGRDALRDHGEMVSGTFSGDAVGLQALCDTLETYVSEPVIDTLWDHARYLRAAFNGRVPESFAMLTGPAPLMGIKYGDPRHQQPFVDGMRDRGVLCFGPWLMVMYAHTRDHLDRVVEAAEGVAHARRLMALRVS